MNMEQLELPLKNYRTSYNPARLKVTDWIMETHHDTECGYVFLDYLIKTPSGEFSISFQIGNVSVAAKYTINILYFKINPGCLCNSDECEECNECRNHSIIFNTRLVDVEDDLFSFQEKLPWNQYIDLPVDLINHIMSSLKNHISLD